MKTAGQQAGAGEEQKGKNQGKSAEPVNLKEDVDEEHDESLEEIKQPKGKKTTKR